MGLCERIFGVPYWATLDLDRWDRSHKDWIIGDVQLGLDVNDNVRYRVRLGIGSSTIWFSLPEKHMLEAV